MLVLTLLRRLVILSIIFGSMAGVTLLARPLVIAPPPVWDYTCYNTAAAAMNFLSTLSPKNADDAKVWEHVLDYNGVRTVTCVAYKK